VTTKEKALRYLTMPEFRNRNAGFMVNALTRKFGFSDLWALGIVREFRRGPSPSRAGTDETPVSGTSVAPAGAPGSAE
jgi:hypothetical protein